MGEWEIVNAHYFGKVIDWMKEFYVSILGVCLGLVNKNAIVSYIKGMQGRLNNYVLYLDNGFKIPYYVIFYYVSLFFDARNDSFYLVVKVVKYRVCLWITFFLHFSVNNKDRFLKCWLFFIFWLKLLEWFNFNFSSFLSATLILIFHLLSMLHFQQDLCITISHAKMV